MSGLMNNKRESDKVIRSSKTFLFSSAVFHRQNKLERSHLKKHFKPLLIFVGKAQNVRIDRSKGKVYFQGAKHSSLLGLRVILV